MMKKRSVLLGDTHYVGPFVASGFWVSDSMNKSVAECRSKEVAQAMALMLNEVVSAVDKAMHLN